MILIEREDLAAAIFGAATGISPVEGWRRTLAEHVVAALPESEPVGWGRQSDRKPEFVMHDARTELCRRLKPEALRAAGYEPVYRKPQP